MRSAGNLLGRVKRLESIRPGEAGRAAGPPDYSHYRGRPVAFAAEVLHVTLSPDQISLIEALERPPYRAMGKAGHNVGKTFAAAVAVLYWYLTRPESVVITTAPDQRAVVDLLWTEIRLLARRGGLSLPFQPAAPYLGEPGQQDHYAKGFTAAKAEGFHGRHRANMLFIFDEAEGVESVYWTTAATQFQPDGTSAWLAIYNPTTTTSQSYLEEQAVGQDGTPKWSVVTLSCIGHPNVLTGLRNRADGRSDPLPYPNAVTLEQIETWVSDWFEPVEPADRDPDLDIEFPPGSGVWLRPDPDGESRVLGRRPTAGLYGVWTERLWQRACTTALPLDWLRQRPEIGCDVARYGTDKTAIYARLGPCALHYEQHSGWDEVRTAHRLGELAADLARRSTAGRDPNAAPTLPKHVRIKVDDTGVGGGVTSILLSQGLQAVGVNAGCVADLADKYPLIRDQLWFQTAALAKRGALDLTRLSPKVRAMLQIQALAPTWRPTVDRRRKVEPKEDTIKRLKFSPDGLDALNLGHHDGGGFTGAVLIQK